MSKIQVENDTEDTRYDTLIDDTVGELNQEAQPAEKPAKKKTKRAHKPYPADWKEKMKKNLEKARQAKQLGKKQQQTEETLAQIPSFTYEDEEPEDAYDDETPYEELEDESFIISPMKKTKALAPLKLKRQTTNKVAPPKAPQESVAMLARMDQMIKQQQQLMLMQHKALIKRAKAKSAPQPAKPPVNINIMPPAVPQPASGKPKTNDEALKMLGLI